MPTAPDATVRINHVEYTLSDLESACWKWLVSAPKRKKDGFRTLTVASVGPDGPDARTVVLREADELNRLIYVHTDRRAAKVAQLRSEPTVTLLFWDEKRQLQLRLRATATVHAFGQPAAGNVVKSDNVAEGDNVVNTGDVVTGNVVEDDNVVKDNNVVERHWRALWVGSRKMYLSEHPPGSARPGPYPGFPPDLGEELPTAERSEAGRANFAVVQCRVVWLEVLHLSRAGQTRARFHYVPEKRPTWLAP